MAKKGNYKGNSNGVKYSKTVTKAVSNWSLRKDILNSTESAKELRKEINRVFHAANRRLQNIENSGVFSPAASVHCSTAIPTWTRWWPSALPVPLHTVWL